MLGERETNKCSLLPHLWPIPNPVNGLSYSTLSVVFFSVAVKNVNCWWTFMMSPLTILSGLLFVCVFFFSAFFLFWYEKIQFKSSCQRFNRLTRFYYFLNLNFKSFQFSLHPVWGWYLLTNLFSFFYFWDFMFSLKKRTDHRI